MQLSGRVKMLGCSLQVIWVKRAKPVCSARAGLTAGPTSRGWGGKGMEGKEREGLDSGMHGHAPGLQ